MAESNKKNVNYKLSRCPVPGIIAFFDDAPMQLIIIKSASSGFYHCIEDEPGPSFAHHFYDEHQIKFLYGIDINAEMRKIYDRSEPYIAPDYIQ